MPALYAHRLGRAYGPDSSRAALARALEARVDGLETDCCLTADGELVLVHDPLLELATTASGWAHERGAREVLGARLLGRDGAPSDEHPMLLDELLDMVPAGLTVQVEVKAHADPALAHDTARAVCARLAEHAAGERAEVISFWTGACEAAAELGFPSRLVAIAEYQLPALVSWSRRAGVHGVCLEHFLLTPRAVASLRAAGLSVATGTVNHPALLPSVLGLGVDAITSDAPHALRAALDAAQALPVAA